MRSADRIVTSSLILVCLLVGCDSADKERDQVERSELLEQLRKAKQEVESARQQTTEIQRHREQDRRVVNARKTESEADVDAAITLWITSSACLVILLLFLVWEFRSRRIIQELLRHLLTNEQEGIHED